VIYFWHIDKSSLHCDAAAAIAKRFAVHVWWRMQGTNSPRRHGLSPIEATARLDRVSFGPAVVCVGRMPGSSLQKE
jgi:hypothetical protein